MNVNFEQLLQLAAMQAMAWAPRFAGAIVVLAVGWMIARWIRGFSVNALQRSQVDPALAPFVSGVLYVGIIAMVGIAAVGVLGIPAASFGGGDRDLRVPHGHA